MNTTREILEGYVVDLACLRKYPHEEMITRALAHTYECAVMGHCVESGYGLVDENGRLMMLDAKATPLVLDTLHHNHTNTQMPGLKLRVIRERHGEHMQTSQVEEA